MTNQRLADIFREVADLLTLKGENPHRIRAYQRAAASLSKLKEPIEAVAARGALTTIPGIGRELSAKIQEFLRTGTITSYEALKTPPPPEVAEWASLPGLSGPLVHHLYYRLGIRTLEDLQALVRSHLLRTLPGLTEHEAALQEALSRRLEGAPADGSPSGDRPSGSSGRAPE